MTLCALGKNTGTSVRLCVSRSILALAIQYGLN